MQINLSKVAECSEVALFEKTFLIFTIKSMMYSRRFRLSLEETKPYFDCVNCSCRNKMSCVSEMNTRWRASNKFQGFLIVPDLRSCTMLSTLPLFYIAQSVNPDDRRARFQGLRVIMYRYKSVKTCVVLCKISLTQLGLTLPVLRSMVVNIHFYHIWKPSWTISIFNKMAAARSPCGGMVLRPEFCISS